MRKKRQAEVEWLKYVLEQLSCRRCILRRREHGEDIGLQMLVAFVMCESVKNANESGKAMAMSFEPLGLAYTRSSASDSPVAYSQSCSLLGSGSS